MSRSLPTATTPRTCGPCQACCRSTTVWSHALKLSSPAGERCPHQADRGCAIYADRPSACAIFRCAWLDGWGRERDRPDRLGLVIERLDDQAVLITQAAPGAFRGRARRLVEDLARTQAVVVLGPRHGDEPAWIGPGAKPVFAHAIRRMQQACADPSTPFVARPATRSSS